MLKTKKEIGYVIGIALALIAIIVVVAVGLHQRRQTAKPDAAAPEPSAMVLDTNALGLTQEQDSVSFETVQEGLNDMGFLVTEEYCFKEVVTRSKLIELFGIGLPLTESSYVGSYEGKVSAGVDFSAITVEAKDFLGKPQITVTIPKPVLQEPVIDHDSFVLYSEKTGIANPFSPDEYNDALVELEQEVQKNAQEKGLADRAEEHARQIIENFVRSLLSGTDYTLSIVVK